MSEDLLIVTVCPNKTIDEPDFHEGDEITLIATFIPGDTAAVLKYRSHVVPFTHTPHCEESWLNEQFANYYAEIRTETPVRLPPPQVMVTEENNVTFMWKWDTSGYPHGCYKVRVCVDRKSVEKGPSDVLPDAKQVDEMQ